MATQAPRIVAFLPMKAVSARVKGKNFREFHGKPLFWWILDTLLSIGEIAQIIINTDGRGILAEKGLVDSDRVRIRDRKPKLCGHEVSMNLILADDVANLPADIYLMTHTTNPMLRAETIRAALNAYQKVLAAGTADSLFTVNRFQTRFYKENGTPINHDPDNLIPTQDLEPWFEENSNLYLFTAQSFAYTGGRIGRRPILFEMSRLEAVDIDDESDWEVAEMVARYRDVTRSGKR